MSPLDIRSRPLAVPLSDGSVAYVGALGPSSSVVSRSVDGVVVWGREYADARDHQAQIEVIVGAMASAPMAFWSLLPSSISPHSQGVVLRFEPAPAGPAGRPPTPEP